MAIDHRPSQSNSNQIVDLQYFFSPEGNTY